MKTYREFKEEAEHDGLRITDQMQKNAVDQKMHVAVHMHPRKFLELTTGGKPHFDEIKQSAKSLHDYNKHAEEGHVHVAPNLKIDSTGKIWSHEGRHRAAAMINAGHEKMHVFLKVSPKANKPERHHGWEDVPDRITGQAGFGEIKKSEMELHRDHVAKLK